MYTLLTRFAAKSADMWSFESDYTSEENFGGISFADARIDTRLAVFRWLDRFRRRPSTSIPVITLDDLCRGQMVSFIKLDIEGMELDALRGGHQAHCPMPAGHFLRTKQHGAPFGDP